jgi:hypothetical protein
LTLYGVGALLGAGLIALPKGGKGAVVTGGIAFGFSLLGLAFGIAALASNNAAIGPGSPGTQTTVNVTDSGTTNGH